MMLVELWLSALYGWYNGAMVVALTEAVPANVRTSGFALAYSPSPRRSAARLWRSRPG
jgi:MHS family citrate/tricarballylate:H+ symporter-like MFS transporter